jgi:hypothetical protein
MILIRRGVIINGEIIAFAVVPSKPGSEGAKPQIMMRTRYHSGEDRIGVFLIDNITLQVISIIPHKASYGAYPEVTKIVLFDKSYLWIGEAFLFCKMIEPQLRSLRSAVLPDARK